VTLPSGHIRREIHQTEAQSRPAVAESVPIHPCSGDLPLVRQFDWGIDVDRISVYFVTSLAASVQPAFRSKIALRERHSELCTV